MTEQYPNRVVWAEIPVSDMARAKAFYEKVLMEKMNIDDAGPNPIAILPYPGGTGASGHLYPGTPAAKGEGPTVHVAAPGELSEAMTRIEEAGGEVVSEVVTIPAGSFFYAVDTEGNSVGIFKV